MPQQTESKKEEPRPSLFFSLGKLILPPELWQKIRKPAISFFILFHAMLNFCYMFNHHPFIAQVNLLFHGYYFFMGLDQDFGVFAPKPRDQNPHMIAVVRYADGTSLLWESPRMERLGFLEKIPKERYRKFFDDNTCWSKAPHAWPDIAKYIARNSFLDESNPPTSVSLIRYSSKIPPAPIPNPLAISEEEKNPKWLPNPPHYEHNLLLTIQIKPEDLKCHSRP